MKLAALFIATLLGAGPAFAQAESTKAPRQQFEEGLAQAQRGDFEAALRSFNAAYKTRPHFSVLYNIAQAELALGRVVEAVASFERYLAEGGEQIAPARRDEVQVLIVAGRRRVGALRIKAGDQARVWLDGRELRRDELLKALTVSAGSHTLLYSEGAGYPVSQAVAITGGTTTELSLPALAKLPSSAMGQVVVTCGTPDMILTVDGAVAGKTPLERPLLLPLGQHVLGFTRKGYRPFEVAVGVEENQLVRASCESKLDPALPERARGKLSVRATPQLAEVLVDGEQYSGGALAAGLHELRVEGDGYVPYRRLLQLESGKTGHLEVVLLPTAATRKRDERNRRSRRTWGYALLGTGAALVGSGVALFVWNGQRYDDWRASHTGSATNELDRVASIQRVDDLALGCVVVGSGVALGGIWALVSGAPSSD